ncbi:MAG: LysM peptidoglycan-binding domain-containing protein [Dehalococcoidia bacterium]
MVLVAGASLALLAAIGPARTFAYTDHVVQPGETLSQIASRYGFPVETLLDVNGLSDADQIHEGQVLRIPGWTDSAAMTTSGRSHTVAAGETLSIIAGYYGVSVDTLVSLNALPDRNTVLLGQVLAIPGVPPAAAEPAAQPADAAPATPAPPASASGRTYVVEFGDVVSAIAASFGVSVGALVEANGLRNADAIHEGQVLVIPSVVPPPPAMHTVTAGETVSQIANQYSVALATIIEANGLTNPNSVLVGQVLTIPTAGAPASTVPMGVQTSGRAHTIMPGETLSAIADHYGFTVEELAYVNDLANASVILVGQTIQIPGVSLAPRPAPGRKHTVSEGEWLSRIAAQYRVSMAAIIAANNIANPDIIEVGTYLTIPASGSIERLPRVEYQRVLEEAAAEFGISAALVKAVAWQESGWNQDVVSHANAFGLMQIIPPTAEWALMVLVHDAINWDVSHIDNARMGAAILRFNLDHTGWDLPMALAGYYQGFEAVRKFGFFEDTKEYIASVEALIPQFE